MLKKKPWKTKLSVLRTGESWSVRPCATLFPCSIFHAIKTKDVFFSPAEGHHRVSSNKTWYCGLYFPPRSVEVYCVTEHEIGNKKNGGEINDDKNVLSSKRRGWCVCVNLRGAHLNRAKGRGQTPSLVKKVSQILHINIHVVLIIYSARNKEKCSTADSIWRGKENTHTKTTLRACMFIELLLKLSKLLVQYRVFHYWSKAGFFFSFYTNSYSIST